MPFVTYRHVRDLPDQLPLFPLRGAILLPRSSLPLNVFEPRYLAMLDHVIATRRVLGVIQPQAPAGPTQTGRTQANERESPDGSTFPLKPVGCAGRVTSYQELEDGRLAISLTGIVRFRIGEERTGDDPYRTFAVSYDDFADDLTPGFGEDRVDRGGLLKVLRLYLEARRLQADWNAVENADTELLVNALSTISPFGPEEKQALLEARDLQHRAEVLTTLATMEMASDDRSGGGVQ